MVKVKVSHLTMNIRELLSPLSLSFKKVKSRYEFIVKKKVSHLTMQIHELLFGTKFVFDNKIHR
jgi:hypothetical protein